MGYDSALSLVVDIRTVIPGSGTTAPVGWAALPLFQTPPGRFMASGYYQLPIFKASPSMLLIVTRLLQHPPVLHDTACHACPAALLQNQRLKMGGKWVMIGNLHCIALSHGDSQAQSDALPPIEAQNQGFQAVLCT